MNDINTTLAERGSRYGDFNEHARITQAIKRAMIDSPNWETLSDDKREALEMVAHKIGRILNGDPSYHDSWHDVIGYTKLVADTLLPEIERLKAGREYCAHLQADPCHQTSPEFERFAAVFS